MGEDFRYSALLDSGHTLTRQLRSLWRHLGCHCGGQCCHEAGSLGSCQAFSASQSLFFFLVGADFGRIPRGALSSRTPSTGMYGCFGWDGGWTEGAFVPEHLGGPGLLHPEVSTWASFPAVTARCLPCLRSSGNWTGVGDDFTHMFLFAALFLDTRPAPRFPT